MRGYWKFLSVLLISLLVWNGVVADFEDEVDEDDGVVEDEPDVSEQEPVILEKSRYEPPEMPAKPYLAETFDGADVLKRSWIKSQAKKDDVEEDIAKYDGKWSVEEPKDSALEGDLGLLLKSKAKHHAVSKKLNKVFDFSGNPFIVSYEVKYQNGIDCGGAYIKLLSKQNNADLKSFHDKTPYTIMFGPDKCGLDHKLHFIFRHKNPKTGEIEEKHAKKPSGNLDSFFSDKKTHLYTLVVNPDNSFEILVDNKVINSGNLLQDMSPPVNPPKEIDDPNDKKPSDWDEREKIPDPDAKKPDDWDEDEPMEVPDEEAKKPEGWLDDEEALIPDPDAGKPDDWDDEMDGEWEAPLIDNPKCKDAPGCGEWTRPNMPNPLYRGKWKPEMIDNPDYKGEWKPRKITNPDFFEDKSPYKMTPIEALGLELWSMTDEIVFDNFIVTDDKDVHSRWVEQTWERKSVAEASKGAGQGIWSTLMSSAEERPWLYAVYIVVFLLPIVLLSICLCPRSGPIKQEDLDAARKKTDEASPDDEKTEDKEDEGVDEGAGGDNLTTETKKSKAALEKEEEEEEVSQEEDMAEGDTEGKDSGSPRRSPRKRKTRKD
ncbi:calnexin-like isoform X1 [Ruditapes philippinarum]|uniref:calnexin-like isoform X1 n=1 Tax=Ruditapes philippinarum TaxID=129788 RepID=UPI00295C23AB|nr:calnexin-like isoform X1 [Ruditapes philippinarum]